MIFNANGNKNWHSFDPIYDAGPDFCFFETAGFLAGRGLRPGIVANAQAGRGFQMTQIPFPHLLDTIRATAGAYYKLTIVAGSSGAGKTHLLKQVATQLDLPIINLSLLLSQRLLSQNRRQRALNAEDVATEVIDENYKSSLCLDDTELLFDSTLRLNPLVFLQDVSRNRLIVATWNGVLAGGELRFGHTSHPDFFRQPVKGFPVVSVAEDKLQLLCTT
jgi:hypothetical protein